MESTILLNGILLILTLIGIAVATSAVLQKIKFPYTIGLVIVGIVIGNLAMFDDLHLSYEMVYHLIIPVLIFEAALNVDSKTFFKNIVPIILLATFGVLISAFIVGATLSAILGLSFASMLLFGALISATDPVAVIALFKEIGAPKRLYTVLEGESMLNDAAAVVLFGIFLAAATPDVSSALLEFFVKLLGGIAVGTAVGAAGSYFCKLNKSGREYQIVLSVIMAYSAFIIAEELHFAGIVGPLAAGVVLSLRAEKVIKRRNREQVEAFWGFFAFLANSFVFLLMGITQRHIFDQTKITQETVIAIVAAIVVLFATRAISVIVCNAPYNFFARKKDPNLAIPANYSAILIWGGLRGVIPAALALALPEEYPNRDLIVQITFACIMFSLFAQGTTIKKLMDKLGLKPEATEIDEGACVKKEYKFPSRGLVDLIIPKVVKYCEDEGFFVRETPHDYHKDYVMRMRRHTFLFRAKNDLVEIIAAQQDLGYASTIMYETIVELNQSLGSIADVMKPDNLCQIISKDASPEERTLELMKYISQACMVVPLQSADKFGVIRELIDIMQINGKFGDAGEVFDAVVEREKQMSTGLGDGVAFPHARTDAVEQISVAVGISRAGVDFDSIDKKPVFIVALILSPQKDSAPHLQFLAQMSKILSKEETRERIKAAKNAAELFAILGNREG